PIRQAGVVTNVVTVLTGISSGCESCSVTATCARNACGRDELLRLRPSTTSCPGREAAPMMTTTCKACAGHAIAAKQPVSDWGRGPATAQGVGGYKSSQPLPNRD